MWRVFFCSTLGPQPEVLGCPAHLAPWPLCGPLPPLRAAQLQPQHGSGGRVPLGDDQWPGRRVEAVREGGVLLEQDISLGDKALLKTGASVLSSSSASTRRVELTFC